MTARRVILSFVIAATALGASAPALASSSDADTKRYCVALSSDPEKQQYAPICVWIPGEADQ